MVEIDFYNYIKSDSELYTLIGATSNDSKIYPLQSSYGAQTPYIIYNLNNDSTLDEILFTANIQYHCVADTYITSSQIKDRLNSLIDIENQINLAIPSGYYKYYYSKLNGSYNYKDPELDIFHYIVNYDITYLDAYGFLLQEDGFYLLQENGYNVRIV